MTIERRKRIYNLLFVGFAIAGAFVVGSAFWRFRANVRHNQSGVSFNQLKLAIHIYAEDYDDRLPPMANFSEFKKAVWPCVNADTLFHSPDDPTILYLPNPHLSNAKRSDVTDRSVLLYESKPSPSDNLRWVAFLPDAKDSVPFNDPDFVGLRLVDESEWRILKAENKLP